MQSLIILAVCVLAVSAIDYSALPPDPYNIDDLHNYPDEMKARAYCFINKGPCDKLTAMYKEIVPDIVKRDCADCSSYLKHYHHVFVINMKKMMPDVYEEYRQALDPENIHFPLIEAAEELL